MFIRTQMSMLPSWVTGSRLSESVEREKVNVPPAVPSTAVGATATGELPAVALAPTGTLVVFWLIVTGALVGAAVGVVAGAALAAGAAELPVGAVVGAAPPQAARSAANAPVTPMVAPPTRKRRRPKRACEAGC
jgi:hypothetical protein